MMRTVLSVVALAVAAGTLYANPSVVASLDSAPSEAGARMQADAAAMQQRINGQLETARRAEAAARGQKDALRSSCLGQSVTITSQLANVSRTAVAELDAAIRVRDTAEQKHQLQTIAALVAESEKTGSELSNCIGAPQIAKRVALAEETGSSPTGSSTAGTTNGSSGADDSQKRSKRHLKVLRADDCSNLGLATCSSMPLEYIAFASPFTPN